MGGLRSGGRCGPDPAVVPVLRALWRSDHSAEVIRSAGQGRQFCTVREGEKRGSGVGQSGMRRRGMGKQDKRRAIFLKTPALARHSMAHCEFAWATLAHALPVVRPRPSRKLRRQQSALDRREACTLPCSGAAERAATHLTDSKRWWAIGGRRSAVSTARRPQLDGPLVGRHACQAAAAASQWSCLAARAEPALGPIVMTADR